MVLFRIQTKKILVYPRFFTINVFGNRENKKYPYIDKYVNSQLKTLFGTIFVTFSCVLASRGKYIPENHGLPKTHEIALKTLKIRNGPLKDLPSFFQISSI